MCRGEIGQTHTWEVDCAIVVGINLIDHVLQFRLAWVLAERAHDCAQLLCSDLTIAILVLLSGVGALSAFVFCFQKGWQRKNWRCGRWEKLTKREKASLNSETCSSVRLSAWHTCQRLQQELR